AAFAAAYFLSYFFRSANAVIAPDLSRDLQLGAQDLGLMTALFYVAFAAVQIPLGAALDRFGARAVTPALMLTAVVGCLLFASAQGFAQLAIGRALIGMGMAGVFMGSLKAFSRWFSARRFARVSGFIVGVGALGALFAGTPLAWLAREFGWRGVFVVGAMLVLVSAAALVTFARNAPPGVEWRVSGPGRGRLIEVFRDIRFWRIALLDFAIVGTLLSVQGLWGGPFAYDTLGFSEIETGNLLVSLSLGSFVGYMVCGWFSERFGFARTVVTVTLVFLGAQAAIIAGGLAGSESVVRVAYPVFGLTGAFNVLLMAHISSVFPASMTGRAVTAVNLFGIGGTALIQWGMGMVIGAFGSDLAGRYPVSAYASAFVMTFTIVVLGLAFYLPMLRRDA
ncbi:MAG: MFS transporter, partial [Actinobacteria bacterium]|nr:MFS transporter [Actinomycetota bacterium]